MTEKQLKQRKTAQNNVNDTKREDEKIKKRNKL